MSTFGKYSRFEPPAGEREREQWLIEQEERIARRVSSALGAIVDDATDAYLDTLTAAGDMGVFDGIPARWGLFVDDYLLDELSGMFLSGGLTAWITADVGDRLPERIVTEFVQVINQNAVEYAQVAKNRMNDVGLTTWNNIKDRVSKAVLSGESVDKTAKAIRENTGFAKKRADMIARTETINAYNNGDWEGDQALGEFGPVYKYWVATLDARGRETHIATNRQVKLMAEPFIVGGEEMLFPHSPGASAKNVVNCRCVYNKLWPGDPHPVTGEPMPEPGEWIDPNSQTVGQPKQQGSAVQSSTSSPLLDELRGTTRYGSDVAPSNEARFLSAVTDGEKAAIRKYTGSAYEDLNYNLRMNASGIRGYELTDEQREMIRHLDSAIDKAGQADPFVVYRGMNLPNPGPLNGTPYSLLDYAQKEVAMAQSIAERYPQGSRISLGGQYGSTSTDIASALDHAPSRTNSGVVFEIEARRGAPVNSLSRYDDEFEVILPRDAQYEVIRVEADVEFDDIMHDRISRVTVVVLREVG